MKRLFQERGCGEARQSDPVVGQLQRVVDNKPVWPDHASNTYSEPLGPCSPGHSTRPSRSREDCHETRSRHSFIGRFSARLHDQRRLDVILLLAEVVTSLGFPDGNYGPVRSLRFGNCCQIGPHRTNPCGQVIRVCDTVSRQCEIESHSTLAFAE